MLALQCFSLHKDTTPPQPNHTVTPTHIKPEEYNTWDKSIISSKLLKMNVITFETCWTVNSEIIKQVTSSWSIFIQAVFMQAEALQCFSLHKDTTPPVTNHTVTPTHIELEQYNPWDKSTIIRKLLKMKVITFETCWAVNSEIIKQVTSSWSSFIQSMLYQWGLWDLVLQSWWRNATRLWILKAHSACQTFGFVSTGLQC